MHPCTCTRTGYAQGRLRRLVAEKISVAGFSRQGFLFPARVCLRCFSTPGSPDPPPRFLRPLPPQTSQDFHLAKRNFDLALSTSADALAPVTLALLKLNLHQRFLPLIHWARGTAAAATAGAGAGGGGAAGGGKGAAEAEAGAVAEGEGRGGTGGTSDGGGGGGNEGEPESVLDALESVAVRLLYPWVPTRPPTLTGDPKQPASRLT